MWPYGWVLPLPLRVSFREAPPIIWVGLALAADPKNGVCLVLARWIIFTPVPIRNLELRVIRVRVLGWLWRSLRSGHRYTIKCLASVRPCTLGAFKGLRTFFFGDCTITVPLCTFFVCCNFTEKIYTLQAKTICRTSRCNFVS